MDDPEAIRFIGLDYYETVVRVTPRMRLQVFDRVGREIGLGLADGELGTRWLQLPSEEWPFDGPTPPFRPLHQIWTERGRALLRELGAEVGGEIVAQRYSEFHATLRPSAEDVAVLADLATRHILGVLSDADAEHLLPSIGGCGLRFEVVVLSEELGNYKPHIGAFMALARRAGVKPTEILYVGDAPCTDIAGAKRAGMWTAWVNRVGSAWPRSLEPPDLEIGELAQLPAWLSDHATNEF